MRLAILSPLGQLLLPVLGGIYAVWRFWVARGHRPRYRTSVEVQSAGGSEGGVIDAIYTVHNNGASRFEIRQVTMSVREAVQHPAEARLVEGSMLSTVSGRSALRVVRPAEEKLVGISPLLPGEYAKFTLRIPMSGLPCCAFVVGEIEIERVHHVDSPGRYSHLFLASSFDVSGPMAQWIDQIGREPDPATWLPPQRGRPNDETRNGRGVRLLIARWRHG